MKGMPHDIEAELTFLRTEDGGRQSVLIQGVASYRPQFHYHGQDWDCVVEIAEGAAVAPGDSTIAVLSFLSPQSHLGRLRVGSPFLLREGTRIVAYGAVSRILNLERSAQRALSGGAG